tara:strand:- start:1214 stop:1396 length:183 start_codon:yes stop_codon:yes gene_type:complete
MKIQIEKRDGLLHETNLTVLAKAVEKELEQNFLVHANAEKSMIINTIYDAVQELVLTNDR